MAQQTAVEWLVNELIFKKEFEHLPNNYFLMSDKDIDKIIEQAKEMEKEQMCSFAEFVTTYLNKNININKEMLHAKSKYDGAERTIDLL